MKKYVVIGTGLIVLLTVGIVQIQRYRALQRGAELAALYCATCHLEPPPASLPKRSWEAALGYMGYWLGIENIDFLDEAPEFARDNVATRHAALVRDDFFPDAPLLNEEQWASLRNYYVTTAPQDPLPQTGKPLLRWELPRFEVFRSSYRQPGAVTTLVHIRETTGEIYVGDTAAQSLTVLDGDGQVVTVRRFRPAISPVDIHFAGDTAYLASIGDVLAQQPASARPGHVSRLHLVEQGIADATSEVAVQNLYRMADLEMADLTGDGRSDLIISGFGSLTGNVAWFQALPGGVYEQEERVLLGLPGAVRTRAHDFNDDGLLDIMALMSDAREGLHIFVNQAEGEFTQETVFETHAGYGHTYFELHDFNDDALMDVLVVNGDNVDSDPYNTRKNYHGIRIYLNRGGLRFEEAYFYPMYGAFNARAADFDADGDLDIAAISFYPDYLSARPEAFTYLENQGAFEFVASTSEEALQGRWMTLDIGDIDADGDVDVVLGGSYLSVGLIGYPDILDELLETGESVLILKNTLN